MADRFDQFTEQTKRVLIRSQQEAQRLHHTHIGTEHFLLGLVGEETGGAAQVFAHLGGATPRVRRAVESGLERGEQPVVNTASVAGLVGGFSAAYSASKHGVVGLIKEAALAYAAQGIRINAVCPGFVRTGMTEGMPADPARAASAVAREPIGRVGTPEEIAAAVVWLCSDAASFVTGLAMAVDGGYIAQ